MRLSHGVHQLIMSVVFRELVGGRKDVEWRRDPWGGGTAEEDEGAPGVGVGGRPRRVEGPTVGPKAVIAVELSAEVVAPSGGAADDPHNGSIVVPLDVDRLG